MKIIVLAAGYATRLYPLTLDRPKALLQVGGRPMLTHVLERLLEIDGIDDAALSLERDLFEGHIRSLPSLSVTSTSRRWGL